MCDYLVLASLSRDVYFHRIMQGKENVVLFVTGIRCFFDTGEAGVAFVEDMPNRDRSCSEMTSHSGMTIPK